LHVPATQCRIMPLQTVVQLPQCMSSLSVSTQLLPQSE
jgi:hypothetical protein